MTKLVWDKIGERLYETGTSNGVLFRVDNTGKYLAGVAWNGLTSVKQSPEGAEPTDLYADNGKYISLLSAEQFKGTIEAYTYPEEFAECDGSATVVPGVYFGQQVRKPFGFAYRTQVGNDTEYDSHGSKLHLIYGAKVSPSERSYETINNDPNAITFSWAFDTTPVQVEGYKPLAYIQVDSTKVDPAVFKALEDKLFGTESGEATLPTPEEVLSMVNPPAGGQTLRSTLTNTDTTK